MKNNVHVGYVACRYATFSDAVIIDNDQNFCYKYEFDPQMQNKYEFDPQMQNPECDAFEKMNDGRGAQFQMIMRYDLEGNEIWCRKYNQGTFFKIIQDSDGNLVAIGITKLVKRFGWESDII